jgi:hypothetical protein
VCVCVCVYVCVSPRGFHVYIVSSRRACCVQTRRPCRRIISSKHGGRDIRQMPRACVCRFFVTSSCRAHFCIFTFYSCATCWFKTQMFGTLITRTCIPLSFLQVCAYLRKRIFMDDPYLQRIFSTCMYIHTRIYTHIHALYIYIYIYIYI